MFAASTTRGLNLIYTLCDSRSLSSAITTLCRVIPLAAHAKCNGATHEPHRLLLTESFRPLQPAAGLKATFQGGSYLQQPIRPAPLPTETTTILFGASPSARGLNKTLPPELVVGRSISSVLSNEHAIASNVYNHYI